MNDKRIPKPGEEWGGPYGATRKVVSVYPDAVTYLYDDNELLAMTLDVFVAHSTPPEPTAVGTLYLAACPALASGIRGSHSGTHEFTHRLDLMSDGEFRVVKL